VSWDASFIGPTDLTPMRDAVKFAVGETLDQVAQAIVQKAKALLADTDPSGQLGECLRVDVSDLDHLLAQIVVDGPAVWVELGTAKMAPKPFLMPAVEEVGR